jgi:periplasmic protein TonB
METKKTEKADLERKSPLFFSIGLIVSMSMIVYAFELKQYDNNFNYRHPVDLIVENVDIPVTDQQPILPPAVKLKQIILVPDDKKIEDDMKDMIDINSLSEDDINEFVTDSVAEPIEETDETIDYAEESAVPVDGISAFYKYVGEKIKYPAQARRMGIEGRVFVSFVIGKDGSVSEVKAVKGIGAGCDEEAVRIIQNAPAWKPGRHGGRTVKQRMVLPVIFKLG